MSRELDEQVARARGWALKETGFPVNFWLGPDGLATGYCDRPWPEDAERYGDVPWMFSGKGVWSPSTDIAAAWEMEDWIEPRPERIAYAFALKGLVVQDIEGRTKIDLEWSSYMREMYWRLAHATPEQRSLAFLAAMEAHNE